MPPSVSKACLIIFARHPKAGQVKTRLIPALGAEGAALVYREMAEHTLNQARAVAQMKGISLRVWFAGGNPDALGQWLGQDLTYLPQPGGDLGDRLSFAFQTAFNNGHQAVVAIGTDCPALSSDIMMAAFDGLGHHDLVLGPATDGGYYLIGLRRPTPDLFRNIAWSTAEVLRQTEAVAERLSLRQYCLPKLTDVDNPEDLALWQQLKTTMNR